MFMKKMTHAGVTKAHHVIWFSLCQSHCFCLVSIFILDPCLWKPRRKQNQVLPWCSPALTQPPRTSCLTRQHLLATASSYSLSGLESDGVQPMCPCSSSTPSSPPVPPSSPPVPPYGEQSKHRPMERSPLWTWKGYKTRSQRTFSQLSQDNRVCYQLQLYMHIHVNSVVHTHHV